MTPDPVLTECLEVLVDGGDLSRTQAERAVGVMMDGAAGEVQMAAFLTALRAKGATAVELAGLAQAVRDRAAHVPVDDVHALVDTCGTGGGPPTVNVSTGAAFIAAATGARVAKHGNRAVTSSSGSADVLEALGARVDLPPEAVATCIGRVGVGFMFAPAHHPAFRHVGPVRRELGIRTAFNLIGEGRQVELLQRIATSLAPNGHLAIETEPPLETEEESSVSVRHMTADTVVLSVSRHLGDRRLEGHFVEMVNGGSTRLRPWSIRWFDHHELATMVEAAGLEIAHHGADWPADDDSFTPGPPVDRHGRRVTILRRSMSSIRA